MNAAKPGRAPDLLPSSGSRRWGQLYATAGPLMLARAARRHDGLILAVTESAQAADQIESELRFFAGDRFPVLHFPDWETLPYDAFSPHQDIISRRLEVLYQIHDLSAGIVVVPISTLIQRLPPRAYVHGQTLIVTPGQKLDIDALRRKLEASGYVRVPQVMEHGEFSLRGSLIDVYPMGSSQPYRIDLFDDEVESIRHFGVETQLSLDATDGIHVLPAREFPFDDLAIKVFRRQFRITFEGDPTENQLYQEVSQGIAPGGIEYYLPLFLESTETLFDYLPSNTLIARIADIDTALTNAWNQIDERYEQCRHDIERPVVAPQELYVSEDGFRKRTGQFPVIDLQSFELANDRDGHNFGSSTPPRLLLDSRSDDPTEKLAAFVESFDGRILFVAESAGRRETLLEMLAERGFRPPILPGWQSFCDGDERMAITVAPIQRGLLLDSPEQSGFADALSIIAEDQLFGNRARQRQKRRRTARDPETIIRDLTDLQSGAPVVHEEYGIGRYRGLDTLTIGEIDTEFLTLEYAGGDKLYVPVHALHLVSRYTGGAPETAPLHRLGSARV